MQEHRVIEKVLDATERMLWSGTTDRDFLTRALDFFRNYADRCHHAKEEGELFPVLETLGVPRQGGPIGCMLQEHDEGRHLLGVVADNLEAAQRGDRTATHNLHQAARRYVAMLRQHIQKEDNVLFVMADQLLGPDEQQQMLEAFDRAQRSDDGVARHERYESLAEELFQWEFAPASGKR